MKRILFTLSVSLALGLCVAPRAFAFWSPERQGQPMLPDFDRRLADRPTPPALAPATLAGLQARVPGVKVDVSRLLGTPCFYSAGAGFLTGGGGAGGAVDSSFLRQQDAKDNHRLIKAFLNQYAGHLGYGAEVLNTAVISRDYVTDANGLRTVVWQQQLDGIDIFQAILMGHVTKNGELVNLATYLVPQPARAADAGVKDRAALQATPAISARQAVIQAAATVGDTGLKFDGAAVSAAAGADLRQTLKAVAGLSGETRARLVWLPLNGAAMRLCWEVILVSAKRGEMFTILVDAETGEALYRRNQNRYLSNADYRAYPSDSPSPFSPGWPTPNAGQPAVTQRPLLTIAALSTNGSPNGWIDDTNNITMGNNVDAYADLNGDGQADQPRVTGNPNRVFDFPMDLAQHPTNYTSASVVQMFYLINKFHDYMYDLGFTEAGGNMQMDNFGRGGLANDPVISQAQSGRGFNNAFMMTTPDGISPTMVCLLFDGPNPMRDSGFDSEVVIHEATHGITERVLGGGVGVNYYGQSGAIHEGNSDWLPLCFLSEATDDPLACYPMGGYITYNIMAGFNQNYYYGIRRYPYSTDMLKNPLTYKDIDPNQALPHTGIPSSPLFPFDPYMASEVHNAGEVWCIALWEVRANLVLKHGWAAGNLLAIKTVLDGQRLSPPNPNFLQLRDAILQADLVNSGGINQPEIWAGFAKRGMGGSATSPAGDTTIGVVEAYDFPGVAVVSAIADDTLTGNGNHTIDYNECNEVRILLRNGNVDTASNIIATLICTNPYVTVSQPFSAYPDLPRGGSSFNNVPFRFHTAPEFPCGSSITFILRIATSTSVQSNSFVMRTGALGLDAFRYNNSFPVAIPDNSPAGVDMPLSVSDFPSPVGKLTVSLHLSHAMDSDLTLQLIAPDGTIITLAQKQGGNGKGYGMDCADASRTVFDDVAVTPITSGFPPFVGSFRPEQPLSSLNGKSGNAVNGIWRLRVIDSAPGNVGTIQCWSLSLYPTICAEGGGPCLGSLAMQVVPAPEPVIVGSNLTYTVTVTNGWPAPAYGVLVSNVAPVNAVLVSAATSQGVVVTNLDGNLLFDFGAITNGMTATAVLVVIPTNVVVTPTQAGFLTNQFTLSLAGGVFTGTNHTTNVISTVLLPSPQVVPAGAHLTTESGPVNQGIDPNETVTVSFGLRNVGALSAYNLKATLLATNGVVLSAGVQTNSYGTLDPGTEPVFRPFTFTALGLPGSVISATLRLTTNGVFYSTARFSFTLGSSVTIANPATITINHSGPSSPYANSNLVSGLTGVVSKVTVTLTKFTHTYPDDVNVLLVSPNGQKVLLMANAGGNTSVTNKNLTFDSTAGSMLADNGAIISGAFRPSSFGSVAAFPAPAPAAPYSTTLDSLRASNPNGTWLLFVNDDTAGDGGFITGGWSLTVETVVPVEANADLAVTMTGSPSSVLAGSPVTYAITVVNNGLNAATGVVLTNTLPAGVHFVSASSSVGTVTNDASRVIANVGNLPAGASAMVTVLAATTVPGNPVASVTVAANELDINPLNNSASVVTTVRSASADLALSLAVLPNPIVLGGPLTCNMSVSNRGPDTAMGVTVTNILPAGTTFQAASIETFALQGNSVIFSLGLLTNGESVAFSLTAVPGVVGNFTNRASVVSSATDANSANNVSNVVFAVTAPAPGIAPAGAALISESFAPANNAIDPGEVVTVNLALFNNGTGATSNLVARLQAGGGVSPRGTQTQVYGALAPTGSSATRAFTFTNVSASGESITVTLALTNAGSYFGTVSFTLPASTVRTFSTNGVILIPLLGAASPYPSTILVSSVTQAVGKVTVTLSRLTHASPSDVQVLLVGPGGQKALLMAGAGLSASDVTLTFNDDAATGLPVFGSLATGSYRPSAYVSGSLPAPAPAGPHTSALSVFSGVDPNGLWKLYVYDSVNGDLGRIDGGWSLNFSTTRTLPGAADIGVMTTATPDTVSLGENVTLDVTVANSGPGDSTGVMLTNVLPAGFNLVSAATIPLRGTLMHIGNNLVCNAGALAVGESFVLRIVGSPAVAGTLTNLAMVAGVEADANQVNNVSIQIIKSPAQLQILHLGNNVVVAWPYPSLGYILEWSPSLGSSANWQEYDPAQVQVVNSQRMVVLTVPGGSDRFFRLRKL